MRRRDAPDDLALQVRDVFARRAAEFGLRAPDLDVRPVFSRGGFVNRSFRVSDGAHALHLKLAVSPEARTALERWYGLRTELERHRAPPVLAHVTIGGASGLVFPVVPGSTPALSDRVLHAALACLQGLWSDDDLAGELPGARGITAAACYADTYHERFTEDLRGIEADRPPFLTTRVLAFMRAEAARMMEAVDSDPAFARVVTAPIHGDMWLDNVVWDGDASWHIVDWDDLRIGDPALDVATLTGPTPADLAPLKRLERVRGLIDPDVAVRLSMLGRASLLDWVIDPLADWVEADAIGTGRAPAVRAQKERIHREALELYRSLYAE